MIVITPNIAAFLAMVIFAEGSAKHGDPYRCTFGYQHVIVDMSDHPAVTQEWMGQSWVQNGKTRISTAAGAYQITKETWLEIKALLMLSDFEKPSQDLAGAFLLKRANALAAIEAGDLPTAIAKCSGTWASLPGSTSGQPQAIMANLMSTFTGAGGTLA